MDSSTSVVAPIYGMQVLGRLAEKPHDVHSNHTGPAILRTSRFISSNPRIGRLQLRPPAPSSSTAQ